MSRAASMPWAANRVMRRCLTETSVNCLALSNRRLRGTAASTRAHNPTTSSFILLR